MTECSYLTMEKEILVVTRGIEKLFIFLAPKPFLIRTYCKRILGFVKKEFLKYVSAREIPALVIMV